MKNQTSLHEGVILRALVSLYKESASNLAQNVDIKLNRLNYLYKMDRLPREEAMQILNYLSTNENEWHKQEIRELGFFFVFKEYLQHPAGKKNAENIITGDNNIIGVENSEITNSRRIDQEGKIKGLIDQVKDQQIQINELKEEKKSLLKTNKTLANLQEKMQARFFKLMNRYDKDN